MFGVLLFLGLLFPFWVWGMPNPAALLCHDLGGSYKAETCLLEGKSCPAWELFDNRCFGVTVCRGAEDCPPGEFCRTQGCAEIGLCKPLPQICPMVYKPVCGCDGHTYGNACEAYSVGANIAYQGACYPRGIVLNLEVSGQKVSLSWAPKEGLEIEEFWLFYAPYPEMKPVRYLEMKKRTTFEVVLPPFSRYYVAIGGVDKEGRFYLSEIKHFSFLRSLSLRKKVCPCKIPSLGLRWRETRAKRFG